MHPALAPNDAGQRQILWTVVELVPLVVVPVLGGIVDTGEGEKGFAGKHLRPRCAWTEGTVISGNAQQPDRGARPDRRDALPPRVPARALPRAANCGRGASPSDRTRPDQFSRWRDLILVDRRPRRDRACESRLANVQRTRWPRHRAHTGRTARPCDRIDGST